MTDAEKKSDAVTEMKQKLRVNIREHLKSIRDAQGAVQREEELRQKAPFSIEHEQSRYDLIMMMVPAVFYENNIVALQKKLGLATWKTNFSDLYGGAKPETDVAPVD